MLSEANEIVQLAFNIGRNIGQSKINAQNYSQLSLLPFDSFADDNVNRQDLSKRTALHAVAFLNNHLLAQELISNGSRVTVKDSRWLTPLHRACASNSYEVAKLLIDNGADRSARDKLWQMPLHVAAANGAIECLKLLIGNSNTQIQPRPGNINATDRGGNSALHHAVFCGHENVVKYLLDNGASLNAFDKRERRVMHWAAAMNSSNLISQLYEAGAELDCRDKLHFTPLHVASSLGNSKAVSTLLALGADHLATTQHGNTAIHLTCLNGHEGVLRLLLENLKTTAKKSNKSQDFLNTIVNILNAKNNSGMTPVHLATASTSGAGCLQYILESTSSEFTISTSYDNDERSTKSEIVRHHSLLDLNSWEYRSHFTPLHLAAFFGRFERAQLLLSYGAKLEICDKFGNTILHIAASQGHDLFVQMILRLKSISNSLRWDTPGGHGATPLHLAAMNGHSSCLSRLIQSAVASETSKFTSKFCINSKEEQSFSSDSDDNIVNNIKEPRSENEEPAENFESQKTELRKHVKRYLKQLMETKDDLNRTLIHASVLGLSLECLRIALMAGGDISVIDSQGRSPLHLCAIAIVLGQDFNKNSSGLFFDNMNLIDSQLFYQHFEPKINALNSANEICEILLRLGLNVNLVDYASCTTLHYAAAFDTGGNLVQLLLDFGANPWAVTRWDCQVVSANPLNFDPLQELIESESTTSTESDRLVSQPIKLSSKLIIENTFSTEKEEEQRQVFYYPIHFAAVMGNSTGIQTLLAKISPSDVVSQVLCLELSSTVTQMDSQTKPLNMNNSTSPLFIAAQKGNSGAIETLLNACLSAQADLRSRCGDSDEDLDEPACDEGIGGSHGTPVLEPRLQILPGCITDYLGRTMLHFAAHFGHLDVCSLLLSDQTRFGIDLTQRDNIYRWNALHYASAQGHVPVVNLLLKTHNEILRISTHSGPFADEISGHLDQPFLFTLMEEFNVPCIQSDSCFNKKSELRTIASPFLADFGDEHVRTPLILAAQNNHIGALELLLSPLAMGVTDKSQNIAGLTVTKWIENRANAVDVYGRSALHRAAANGYLECVNLLLKKGANLQTRDFRGRHALHMVAVGGNLAVMTRIHQVIRASIDQFTDPDESVNDPWILDQEHPLDEKLFSPLHFASYLGHTECVRYLLDFNSYQLARGNSFTPIHCASMKGHVKTLELLISVIGFSCLLSQDSIGLNALHLAAQSDQVDCATLLLTFEEDIAKEESETNYTDNDNEPKVTINSIEIRVGSLCSSRDIKGRTPIMLAAANNSTNVLSLLLEFHLKICILHPMARSLKSSTKQEISNDFCLIQLRTPSMNLSLLESAAAFIVTDVKNLDLCEAVDDQGLTALHHACLASTDAAGLLILAKIRDSDLVNRRDHFNRTPAHLAITTGLPKLLANLISRGANMYAVDQEGRIPALSCAPTPEIAECLSLCLAAMFPNVESVQNPLKRPNFEKQQITNTPRIHVPLTSTTINQSESDSEFY